MDLLELLQILFCCMYPVRRKRRQRTRVSAPLTRVRRPRAVVVRGADKHRRIAWLRHRTNYTEMRKKILRSIFYDISRTLVAWCPQMVVPNDYVATLLHRYGDVLAYQDNWDCRRNDVTGLWAGTVVQYSTVEAARRALRELPMACRHIEIVPLEHILCLLVDCELLHGELGRHSSRVVVSGRRFPQNQDTFTLCSDLASYGEIEKLLFKYRPSPGVLCEVSYPFVTQAYLASVMLEGSQYDTVRLSAHIDATPRDEEIIEDARRCLMFTIESYLPR